MVLKRLPPEITIIYVPKSHAHLLLTFNDQIRCWKMLHRSSWSIIAGILMDGMMCIIMPSAWTVKKMLKNEPLLELWYWEKIYTHIRHSSIIRALGRQKYFVCLCLRSILYTYSTVKNSLPTLTLFWLPRFEKAICIQYCVRLEKITVVSHR